MKQEAETEKVSDLCPNRIILTTVLRIDQRGLRFKQEDQVGDVVAWARGWPWWD